MGASILSGKISGMGWVSSRISNQQAFTRGLPIFWDAIRDNIGQAVTEFNESTGGMGGHTIDHTDCTARGRRCTRLHKALNNSAIEIFMNESDKSLRTQLRDGAESTICNYRLDSDGSKIEAYTTDKEGNHRILPIADVCEIAVGDFMFTPFPTSFVKPPSA